MDSMFENNRVFDQNIKKWDVKNVNSHTNFNKNCPLQDKHNPFIQDAAGGDTTIIPIDIQEIWKDSVAFKYPNHTHGYTCFMASYTGITPSYMQNPKTKFCGNLHLLDYYFSGGTSGKDNRYDAAYYEQLLHNLLSNDRGKGDKICKYFRINSSTLHPEQTQTPINPNNKFKFSGYTILEGVGSVAHDIYASITSSQKISSTNAQIEFSIGGTTVFKFHILKDLGINESFYNLENTRVKLGALFFDGPRYLGGVYAPFMLGAPDIGCPQATPNTPLYQSWEDKGFLYRDLGNNSKSIGKIGFLESVNNVWCNTIRTLDDVYGNTMLVENDCSIAGEFKNGMYIYDKNYSGDNNKAYVLGIDANVKPRLMSLAFKSAQTLEPNYKFFNIYPKNDISNLVTHIYIDIEHFGG